MDYFLFFFFISIIATSFYEKADLEEYLKPNIFYENYVECLEKSWQEILTHNLSFLVVDCTGRKVGVSYNMDGNTETEIVLTSQLSFIYEFLDHVESRERF